MNSRDSQADGLRQVVVVGGGLAGLAAAVALSERGLSVDLYESRRRLGGRATSFRDDATGALIDNCQHVGMGCCTNLLDFCSRTGLLHRFRRDSVLHFFSPAGRRHDLKASRVLPAPLHLARSLFSFSFLSPRERCQVAIGLLKMARQPEPLPALGGTIGQWLVQNGQSPRAIERFWSVVLVSALGESVENASFAAARKVFVDGFMASRGGFELLVPTVSLDELYGKTLTDALSARGVSLHTEKRVARVDGNRDGAGEITFSDGDRRDVQYVILAVPWRAVGGLLSKNLAAALPEAARLDQLVGVPITSVHLWFDRPILDLPHAVLVDRLSQWVFTRGQQAILGESQKTGYYYQVVISASRRLIGIDQQELVRQVCDDLATCWPAAREMSPLHWRIVTERNAVFSVTPKSAGVRPAQKTGVPNLFLAGDWTDTTWPATMEGAVRSGYLAAEGVLEKEGKPARDLVVPDLPRGRLARWLIAD